MPNALASELAHQLAAGQNREMRRKKFYPRCNTMNSYCSARDWPLLWLSVSRTRKNGLSRDARVLKQMRLGRVRLPRRIFASLPLVNGTTVSSEELASPKAGIKRV